MKSHLLIFFSLVALNLIVWPIKMMHADQQQEMKYFIYREIYRKEIDISMYREALRHATWVYRKEIPIHIYPHIDSSAKGEERFPFRNFQHYLDFLMEANPDMHFDTIENIHGFPDSLHFISREDNAKNEMIRLFTHYGWFKRKPDVNEQLSVMLHEIKQIEDSLLILMDPLAYQSDHAPSYALFGQDTQKIFSNPIPYTGDLRNISFIQINTVTHERDTLKIR